MTEITHSIHFFSTTKPPIPTHQHEINKKNIYVFLDIFKLSTISTIHNRKYGVLGSNPKRVTASNLTEGTFSVLFNTDRVIVITRYISSLGINSIRFCCVLLYMKFHVIRINF